MGAINKLSNERESPLFANKKDNYMCPDCNKDVIFKKGKIKKAHFAHKASEIKCSFYDKPSETEIHYEAKILMKSLLNNKKELHFYRNCSDCNKQKIIDITYNENDKALIEYKFYYNDSNRSADVALVEDKHIKYIFEICYKHKTKEYDRPEPWVEIDAEELIKNINEYDDNNIECIREYTCDDCNETNKQNKIDDNSESDDEGRLLNYKIDYWSKNKCYGCGKNTHYFKDCHLKKIPKCSKCKNYGHRYINCIKDTYTNTTCYKCKQFGHMSKNCIYKKFFNGCYKCGKADHLTNKCTKNIKNINIIKIDINNVDFID
jgi:hypothetical protein